MNLSFDREIRFEIVAEIGVLKEHSTGWKKEINVVAWNGNAPRYDIRDWSPDHNQMSRGITLTEDEMRSIFRLLQNRGRGEE